jgi:nucleotide-binding universal stress UspA family protein
VVDRILVALDGSPLSEATLPHAVAVARAFGAEILILRVLASRGRLGEAADPLTWRLGRAEAERYLADLAESLGGRGLAVRTELTEGDAASEIVAAAERHGVGLISLGSHGEGGLTPFPLSSTAQKVIARTGTSVLLARGRNGPAAGAWHEPTHRRVVVPVDGSQRAEWALFLAASVARSQAAELVLVSIAPIPETVRRPPLERRVQRLMDEAAALNLRWTEEYLDEMKRRLEAPDLVVRTVVSSSRHVRHELDPLLLRERADLVVISAHGSAGNTRGPFGSVSSHLIHHGSTPLLVFQDQSSSPLEPGAPEWTDDEPRHAHPGA